MTAAAPTADPAPLFSRRVSLALWFGITASIGILLFLYKHLERVTAGLPARFLDSFISEMTGAFAAGLLYFPLARFIRRYPLRGRDALRRLPLYLLALVLFGLADTSLMWLSRELLFPLAGLGDYDYGRMPLRYAMEFPVQFVGFWIIVAAVHAVRHIAEGRVREVRTLQLESALVRAQRDNLRLQLQPHFLFNALNTISAKMYDEPAAADEMLERLAMLLRMSLSSDTDEVPLSAELEILDAYVAIMKARFGTRLTVDVDVDEAARAAEIPPMLLQPLVENAVRHGAVESRGAGTIRIAVRRDGDDLLIGVDDDGPGSRSEEIVGKGVGLSATAERLRLLYGDRHHFRAGNNASGFAVAIRIPFRTKERQR